MHELEKGMGVESVRVMCWCDLYGGGVSLGVYTGVYFEERCIFGDSY